MSLSEAYAALRAVPPPVRELVVELVRLVLDSPSPETTARKAVEAIRTKAIDEALKKQFDQPKKAAEAAKKK